MSDQKTHDYDHADNPALTIEALRNKCEILEKNLYKSQIQIQKNEITINKLQDMISLYGNNTNNTSNSFMLPSEFKSNWESLVKDLIMEAFENVFDCAVLLAHMVQETVLIVYNETKTVIFEKIESIVKSLNIGDQTMSSISSDKFFVKFRILFQEYFSSIFKCGEVFISKILVTLGKNISEFPDMITKGKEQDIKRDLQSKSLITFIQLAFKLCVYMHLHDPQLAISITPFDKRKLLYHYYNKSEYMNIEGFGKDMIPCLVILPPPLIRNNFAYQGIKPTVYIISNANEEINQECEKNKGSISSSSTHKTRAHSSWDLNGNAKSGTVEEKDEKGNSNSNNSNVNNNSNKVNTTNPNNNSAGMIHSTMTNVIPIRKKIFRETENSSKNSEKSSQKSSPKFIIKEGSLKNIANLTLANNNSSGCNANAIISKEEQSIPTKDDSHNKANPVNANNNASNKLSTITNSTQVNRSCSHNNVKNPSRNSSALESFNNSLNKDSIRTSDGVPYQKSSRKNKTPLEGEINTAGPVKLMNINNNMINSNMNSIIIQNEKNSNSQNKSPDYNLNEKLSNISNSFSLLRNKAIHDKANITAQEQKERESSNQKKKNDNLLRLNLNANQANNKKYNLCNRNLGNDNQNNQPISGENAYMKNAMCLNTNLKSNYEMACLTIKKNSQEMENQVHPEKKERNLNFSNHKESKYESSYKNSEPNDRDKEEIKDCKIIPQNSNVFLNRNNSQLSDIRYEDNASSINTNSNQLSVTNTSLSKAKISKAPPLTNASTSPKTISSSKIKSLLDQISAVAPSSTTTNPNASTAMKSNTMKHVYLEYQNKANDMNTNTNLASGVMFNSKEYFILNEGTVCGNVGNYNETNSGSSSIRQCPGPGSENYSKHVQHTSNPVNKTETSSNVNNPKVEQFEGSTSNRITTNTNYVNASSLLNDMKFNGPKKDEFNLKISQGRDMNREKYCGGERVVSKANSNNTNTQGTNINLASTGSPKNIIANITDFAKIRETPVGRATHNSNTYTLNYKDKIMKFLENKTVKPNLNYQNVNSNVSSNNNNNNNNNINFIPKIKK